VVVGLVTIGMVLVIYGTIAKNRWGIDLSSVSCSSCKATLPPVRKPASLQQALWGGHTCPACRVEVDKWGRQLDGPNQ